MLIDHQKIDTLTEILAFVYVPATFLSSTIVQHEVAGGQRVIRTSITETFV